MWDETEERFWALWKGQGPWTPDYERALEAARLARQDAVYAARQSGMTWRAISERFGFTASRASQIYHQAERRHRVEELAEISRSDR
jgi:hypothetical protein